MKKFLLRRQVVFYLLFYFLIIWYTLTFPTTVAWFLFYAFTLFLVVSYSLSSHTLVVRDINWEKYEANELTFKVKLSSKWKLPLFLSSLKVTVTKDDSRQSHHQTAYFRRFITVSFQPLFLSRGRHDSVSLYIEGVSLFGLWSKWSTHTIPVEIDIYPIVLQKSSRASLMKEVSPMLSQAQHSTLHDFYVKELRSFQNRDSLSDIDWKTSMRRGQWMVKEYEREEEAPIDLYFYGYSSEAFEELLSLTYNLYLELQTFIKGNIYLIGSFENSIDTRQSQQAFLNIEPSDDHSALDHQLNESLISGRKHIIVKPDACPLPIHNRTDQSFLILNEQTLRHFKTNPRM